jgi:hypothetical protein
MMHRKIIMQSHCKPESHFDKLGNVFYSRGLKKYLGENICIRENVLDQFACIQHHDIGKKHFD